MRACSHGPLGYQVNLSLFQFYFLSSVRRKLEMWRIWGGELCILLLLITESLLCPQQKQAAGFYFCNRSNCEGQVKFLKKAWRHSCICNVQQFGGFWRCSFEKKKTASLRKSRAFSANLACWKRQESFTLCRQPRTKMGKKQHICCVVGDMIIGWKKKCMGIWRKGFFIRSRYNLGPKNSRCVR